MRRFLIRFILTIFFIRFFTITSSFANDVKHFIVDSIFSEKFGFFVEYKLFGEKFYSLVYKCPVSVDDQYFVKSVFIYKKMETIDSIVIPMNPLKE